MDATEQHLGLGGEGEGKLGRHRCAPHSRSQRSELCSSHVNHRCEEMTRGETARALLESVANLVAVSQENIPSSGCHKCWTEQRIRAAGEERAGEKGWWGKNGKKKSEQGQVKRTEPRTLQEDLLRVWIHKCRARGCLWNGRWGPVPTPGGIGQAPH